MAKLQLNSVWLGLSALLIVICYGQSAMAQSAQTVELSSASILVDSVDTPEKAQQVKAILYDKLAIRDFDQKNGGKINYTFLDNPEQQSVAIEALKNAGYSVKQTHFKANMTVTVVPHESHVVEQKEAHPADADGNGDITEQEYKRWKAQQPESRPKE